MFIIFKRGSGPPPARALLIMAPVRGGESDAIALPGQAERLRSPRAAAAVKRAGAFISIVSAALFVAVLVSWGSNDQRVLLFLPSTTAAQFLRVAMVFSTTTMLGVSGAALVIGRALPGNVGQIDSAVISAVHTLVVSLAAFLISIVGLSTAPVLVNSSDSRLVASLDVLLIPALRLYMQHILLEVVHAQRTSPVILGLRAFRAAEPPLPFTLGTPRQTALLVTSNVLVCLGYIVTRVVSSRSAAAAIFCVTVIMQLPSMMGFARACRELITNSKFAIFVYCGWRWMLEVAWSADPSFLLVQLVARFLSWALVVRRAKSHSKPCTIFQPPCRLGRCSLMRRSSFRSFPLLCLESVRVSSLIGWGAQISLLSCGSKLVRMRPSPSRESSCCAGLRTKRASPSTRSIWASR